MGKFCTKCGRQLQEGEICTCQQQQVNGQNISQDAEESANEQMTGNQIQIDLSQTKEQAVKSTKNFLVLLMSVVKEPVTAGRTFLENSDIKNSVTFIIVQGILSGIFSVLIGNAVLSSLQSMLWGLMDDIFSSSGMGMLELDTVKVLCMTLAVSVLSSCILALLLMCGYRLLKRNVDYKQMLAVVSVRSALLIPAILLSLIVSLINSMIAIALFIVLGICGFIAMMMAANSYYEDESNNRMVYVWSVVIIVFILICIFVLSKIWVHYIPSALLTALNSAAGFLENPLLSIMEQIL